MHACFNQVEHSAWLILVPGRASSCPGIFWCRGASATPLMRAADRQDRSEAGRCREGALGPREGPKGYQRHPTPVPRFRTGVQ